MSIRTTIIVFASSSALLLLIIILFFFTFSTQQRDKLESLINHDLAFSRSVDQTYSIGLRAGIAMRNMVINPRDNVAVDTFEQARKDFSLKANESRQTSRKKAGAIMGEVAALWEKAGPRKDQIAMLIREGKSEQAIPLVEEDTENWREIKQLIDRAKEEQDRELAESIQQNRESLRKGHLAIGGLLLLGIIGLISITVIAFRRILRPLSLLVFGVARVGSGDLSHSIPVYSNDEMGRLSEEYNTMVAKLGSMVGKLACSSAALKSAATQIAATAQQVVTSSDIQVMGVNETSSAVEEITSSIQSVAQSVETLSCSASESSTSTLEMAANIEEVAHRVEGVDSSVGEVSASITEMAAAVKQINRSVQNLSDIASLTASSIAEMDSSIKEVESNTQGTVNISQRVLDDALYGKKSVEDTLMGIDEIRKASEITIKVINTLAAKTDDIGKILLVIDEVTKQTNLLALNASIIAAHAGSEGRSFAVVADEIKELSTRTRESTLEIAEVIKTVQDETQKAAASIEMAEKSIVAGERLSQESQRALVEIVTGVQQASERMNQIAIATSEQAKGSQMIRKAMEQVSEMVHQIAKATNEQGKGSEMIMASTETMSSLTREGNIAIREQANVSNFIARKIEQINNMINQISRATTEQSQSSTLIFQSMMKIKESADANAAAVGVLDDVVANLSQQIDILQMEISQFRL